MKNNRHDKLGNLNLKLDKIDDTSDRYHIEKFNKIKRRILDRYEKKHGDNGISLAFEDYEDGFLDEHNSGVLDRIYDKYFNKKEIENILELDDIFVDFLKNTVFRKVSFIPFEEFQDKGLSSFRKDDLEIDYDGYRDFLKEIRSAPIEGQVEFNFSEVVSDDNIVGNEDGVIYTDSNYIYEFEDFDRYANPGTWSVIKSIIDCIDNEKEIQASNLIE